MKDGNVDIERIQEFILSFAEGNFSKRAKISPFRDDTDTILAGINMLGEELESLTVSRDYFLSIYNAIADLLFVVDNEGVITNANDSVFNKIDKRPTDIINSKVEDLFTDDRTFELIVEKFVDGQLSNSFETYVEGEEVMLPVRCSISRIKDANTNHQGYLIIATDISFEKEMEKEILNTMISTEEKEKSRIAYDLHDSLGQELNAIRMYFDLAMRLKNNEEGFESIINTCKKLVDGSIKSVRKIAKDLIPKALEDGELFGALNELSSSISDFVTVEKELPDVEFKLETDKKVKIYRIIQEFFTNSMKHSGADQLQLTAGENNEYYFFRVSDNGKGFNKRTSKPGNGVKNIETRLKALDARYAYNSKHNYGTTLKFELKK